MRLPFIGRSQSSDESAFQLLPLTKIYDKLGCEVDFPLVIR